MEKLKENSRIMKHIMSSIEAMSKTVQKKIVKA